MHRNTLILIVFLSIIAALVTGVNLGRTQTITQTTAFNPTPTIVPSPTPMLLSYVNTSCGLAFTYPDTFTPVELDNGTGATFAHRGNPSESLTLYCQKTLPRPKELDDAQEYNIGTVSALLARPVASESAIARGRLYFRHPKNKLYLLLSGSEDIFKTVLESIQLQ